MKTLREDLRKWFGRKGAKGKTGGWVDCNSPDGKGGYKPCGRKKGEKRKYPACRPTPAGCKDKGKGKKWGKKSGKSKKMKKEDLMNIIREELSKIMVEKKKSSKKKDDACTRKVKARYKVWPSAYASGAVSKCRKVGAANWGNKSKKNEEVELKNPKKADLNKDGKLSSYEKARGKGIEKAMGLEEDMSVSELLEMEIVDENITEAKYKGKTVKLNKPMRGDSKKFKVYVNSGKKNADGSIKVKKVNFGHGGTTAKKAGQKTMKIRKSNPKARAAFRKRHRCDNPGPKTMARYWSCKKW